MFVERLFGKNSNSLRALTWTKYIAKGWLTKDVCERNLVKAVMISDGLLAGVISVLGTLSPIAYILDIV
jgi:hypothetical protein